VGIFGDKNRGGHGASLGVLSSFDPIKEAHKP